tara:strand:- start:3920 stop:4609 length:690 start_codon:yes stop_codon:yes gene_type:complete
MRLLLIILSVSLLSCGANDKTIAEVLVNDIPAGKEAVLSTIYGDMIILLYDETPLHQENFIKLMNESFYDDLIFHRVINSFMIQGGDPNSRGASADTRLGAGGPGYSVPAEFNPKFVHKKGALAAARTNNPQKESSGSQFYIVHGKKQNDADINGIQARIAQKHPGFKYTEAQRAELLKNGGTPFLDMDYTVFGEVISGLRVIDSIAQVATLSGDRPLVDVKMSIKMSK